MKVFTNNTFEGHWPVGTAAVIVAETAEDARVALMAHLIGIGLPQEIEPSQMIELDTTTKGVLVLRDGEY